MVGAEGRQYIGGGLHSGMLESELPWIELCDDIYRADITELSGKRTDDRDTLRKKGLYER